MTCGCGETKTSALELDANNHENISVLDAVDPTCTESGLTEGKKCSVCDTIIVVQEEIPATGQHIFNDWAIMVNPTCESEGEQHRWCTICSILEIELLPAISHASADWKVVKEPQIGVAGLAQFKCTVCGKVLTERVLPALEDSATFTPGDVNNDGKITAADARIVLRASAQLEKLDEKATSVADVNKDNKITAADARTILRVSAQIESF